MFAWPLTSMAPWSARRPGSSLDVCDLFCYNPAWFQYLYLTSFLILHGICHMLNATSDFFDMIICLTYLHLFSRKVAIKNSWNKIDIFMFVFLMQCSFGGVSPGGKRPSICQRRTGSRFAVCPSKSLARYERSPMCVIGKKSLLWKQQPIHVCLPYPLQRRWPTAGSTTSSQFSCIQIAGAWSPKKLGTFTSPKWKLRMQETILALFPVQWLAKVSSPSSSHSSPYPLMTVSK